MSAIKTSLKKSQQVSPWLNSLIFSRLRWKKWTPDDALIDFIDSSFIEWANERGFSWLQFSRGLSYVTQSVFLTNQSAVCFVIFHAFQSFDTILVNKALSGSNYSPKFTTLFVYKIFSPNERKASFNLCDQDATCWPKIFTHTHTFFISSRTVIGWILCTLLIGCIWSRRHLLTFL